MYVFLMWIKCTRVPGWFIYASVLFCSRKGKNGSETTSRQPLPTLSSLVGFHFLRRQDRLFVRSRQPLLPLLPLVFFLAQLPKVEIGRQGTVSVSARTLCARLYSNAGLPCSLKRTDVRSPRKELKPATRGQLSSLAYWQITRFF